MKNIGTKPKKLMRPAARALILCAALMLSLSLLMGGTLAWLSGTDERDNEIKVADLKGTLSVPASGISGNYTVKNESDQPAVVRVMVLPVVTKNGALLSDEVVEYTLNTAAGWMDGGDGYFYYINCLASGASADLFSANPHIISNPDFSFSEADVTVKLKAEFSAATKWNYSGDQFYAYRDAWFGGYVQPGSPRAPINAALENAVDGVYPENG
jgi:hypothetical protein